MRPRHTPEPPTPITGAMPLVQVIEHDDGTIAVTQDGQFVVSGPIDRASLGQVLAAVAEQHGGPVRVELTEASGRVLVDVLAPPTRPSRFAPPAPPPTRLPQHTPRLLEITGAGFVPGEDVQVAVILAASSAAADGTARGLVDPNVAPDQVRGVILFGSVSGTAIVEYL